MIPILTGARKNYRSIKIMLKIKKIKFKWCWLIIGMGQSPIKLIKKFNLNKKPSNKNKK